MANVDGWLIRDKGNQAVGLSKYLVSNRDPITLGVIGVFGGSPPIRISQTAIANRLMIETQLPLAANALGCKVLWTVCGYLEKISPCEYDTYLEMEVLSEYNALDKFYELLVDKRPRS